MALANRMQQQELIVVQIEQVDLPNRIAHVRDKTNSPLMVSFREAPGGIFHVPAADEKWTAKRVGTTWRLEQKLDSLDDHLWAADNMDAGDTRIDGTTLHINADEIVHNGNPLGTTTYAAFTADGTAVAYTLPETPVSPLSIQAFTNGLLIDPRTLNLSGPVITFGTPPAAGALLVYYQRAAAMDTGFGTGTYGSWAYGS